MPAAAPPRASVLEGPPLPAGPRAASVVCMLQGACAIRMHDVPAAVDAARMMEALLGFGAPARPRQNLPEEWLG